MTPEVARFLAESTVLPLTSWYAMDLRNGGFYAMFNSGPLKYSLMLGTADVPIGIAMATKALVGGKILPPPRRVAPGAH